MRALFLAMMVLTLGGCQSDDLQQQKSALTLAPESMAQRQMQTRRFDTKDESAILSATSAVLQDLGFTIEEVATRSGLIVGSKDRDAIESQQMAGQVFIAALITALGGRADPEWDLLQKIRVSIVTRPASDKAAVVVRVTFQRIVWNNKRQVSRVEAIADPVIYQRFFDKLSESVFLEAHQI
ncbi:hypothetical protein K678_06285 [Magnetospirillum fulvum MGU-K5]|uniref:Lipoprotein n=2 Tax=Magnetospirillum fulvum TaxID=1082 RepID=S9SCA8_MAGFU|nr:hypothetical protein K678_06285 [Magnetospirillum fulvum MGU-K5]